LFDPDRDDANPGLRVGRQRWLEHIAFMATASVFADATSDAAGRFSDDSGARTSGSGVSGACPRLAAPIESSLRRYAIS